MVLSEMDRETLFAWVDDRVPIPDPDSEKIRECYEFFKEELQEAGLDTDKFHHIGEGIQRLHIVDVGLHYELDDPQMVFESLNSTGLEFNPI